MNPPFVGALVAFTCLFALSHPGPAADLPPAQELLNRYIEASGGRPALEKIKSRVMTGKIAITVVGTTGRFEVHAKVPNRQTSTLEFDGFGTMREGYDGKVAWTLAPVQGVREKKGGELARVQRTTGFPRELRLGEAYARFETRGAGKVGSQPTWVVEASPKDKDGKPDRLHFDQKTGLLVREESLIETPVGALEFEVDLSDYREFDGVKVPCSVRATKPAEMGFHITIDAVKHNVDLPDAEFSKPKD